MTAFGRWQTFGLTDHDDLCQLVLFARSGPHFVRAAMVGSLFAGHEELREMR